MPAKHQISRMTIDIPAEDHRRLKALAAIKDTSMRELVANWIHGNLYDKNSPNADTLKAIADTEKRKGVSSAGDASELFKKLDI